MKRALLVVTAAITLLTLLLLPAPARSAEPRYQHLEPGGQPSLAETVPVNVVFLGYSGEQAGQAAFRAGLPVGYEPVVRSRLAYGIAEELGISYRYDYRLSYTDRRYEDRFFGQLKKLARKQPLTQFQTAYNAQRGNAVTVTDNHEISAPAVERWLADNPPAGVDTGRNTVFLINWYGRTDFRFHVYSKSDEPDPDTGVNFGERDSRKLIAWGGTTARDEENGLGRTRRVWFFDQSAGPETWAGSYNVDDADLDGDEVPDYRIPPVWEYGHYRPRSALVGDLARLTRYVALNLLFTSSPLYPVELPTPERPRTINLDSNTYEGWPGVDASESYITPGLLTAELQELLRDRRLDYDNQDLPLSGQAETCYDLLLVDESCYPDRDFPAFANLYLQNTEDLARTEDDGDTVDYELPIFNYAVDKPTPALGFADDNYRDGTQSYVFTFISPEIVESGYGLTTSMIHEVGHHVGLSHPHDGYDSATRTDYGPSGPFYFVNSGDESNSMMSYIDLNWDFGQFDQDNLYRFQSAAAIEGANRLAAAALAADRPAQARRHLTAADVAVGSSERSFARHDYQRALTWATLAYRLAVVGAEAAGVDVGATEQQARQARSADERAEQVHQPGDFIDTLDGHGPRGQR